MSSEIATSLPGANPARSIARISIDQRILVASELRPIAAFVGDAGDACLRAAISSPAAR